MKFRQSSPTMLIARFMCVGLLAAGTASAAGPRPRQVDAVVRSVDRESQTLILNHDTDLAPKKLLWTKETLFVRNDTSATSTDLAEGVKANVRYRWPFFGKPFATHIAWRSETAR